MELLHGTQRYPLHRNPPDDTSRAPPQELRRILQGTHPRIATSQPPEPPSGTPSREVIPCVPLHGTPDRPIQGAHERGTSKWNPLQCYPSGGPLGKPCTGYHCQGTTLRVPPWYPPQGSHPSTPTTGDTTRETRYWNHHMGRPPSDPLQVNTSRNTPADTLRGLPRGPSAGGPPSGSVTRTPPGHYPQPPTERNPSQGTHPTTPLVTRSRGLIPGELHWTPPWDRLHLTCPADHL